MFINQICAICSVLKFSLDECSSRVYWHRGFVDCGGIGRGRVGGSVRGLTLNLAVWKPVLIHQMWMHDQVLVES